MITINQVLTDEILRQIIAVLCTDLHERKSCDICYHFFTGFPDRAEMFTFEFTSFAARVKR